MKMMNKDERVMVFIDLRNVLRSAEWFGSFDCKMDYESMVDILVGERRLVGAYMFDSVESESDPCNRMYNAFRSKGFRVITRGPNKEFGEQKEVDVAMACEILSHAYKDNYDTAIVVSGDRDFRPAIEHIQAAGKRAEVAGFSKGMSWRLSRCCDVFHDLDPLPLFYLNPNRAESIGEPVLDPIFMLDDILSREMAEAM
jgi:uncharacterized protein (TIGR00288 family)